MAGGTSRSGTAHDGTSASDELVVVPLTPADEQAIAGWQYAGRDDVYDPGDAVRADEGYVGLRHPDEGLVGYVCSGAEARVPGLEAVAGVVDLGVGLRPDLVGGGWGRSVSAAAVAWARSRAPEAGSVRAAVLAWNTRSRRTVDAAGFRSVGDHETPDGRRFVVVERPL